MLLNDAPFKISRQHPGTPCCNILTFDEIAGLVQSNWLRVHNAHAILQVKTTLAVEVEASVRCLRDTCNTQC